MSIKISDIRLARTVLAPHLAQTPISHSDGLSSLCSRDIFIKWDNKFKTGSFKERGALYFLLNLQKKHKSVSICTASAGNHALAVSWHAKQLGIPCTIFMPRFAPLVKVQTSSEFGADVRLEGENFDEAYAIAMKLAKEKGMTFVPGFDHPDIIAGQGVSGLEIADQIGDQIDSVVIPIGGGGLAAGIALALKETYPEIFVLGVRSEWTQQHSSTTHFTPSPIADGIAVKTIGKHNDKIIKSCVDEIVYVSERAIGRAIIDYLYCERAVLEGAGAASLAAVREGLLPEKYQSTALLACGSNIDLNILARLIRRSQFQEGKLVRVTVSAPDRPGTLAQITERLSEEKANIIETFHERACSDMPGNVDITFLLEVRGVPHREQVMENLAALGLNPVAHT